MLCYVMMSKHGQKMAPKAEIDTLRHSDTEYDKSKGSINKRAKFQATLR